MSRSLAAAASAVALAAVLVGCSAPAPSGGTDGSGGSGDQPPAASGDFCTEFEANGGSAATVGVPMTFVSKEEMLDDVQPRLDAMGDLTAPDEISAEWTTMKEYYGDLVAAAEALPDGAPFNTSPEYQTLAEAPDDYQVVVEYVIGTC